MFGHSGSASREPMRQNGRPRLNTFGCKHVNDKHMPVDVQDLRFGADVLLVSSRRPSQNSQKNHPKEYAETMAFDHKKCKLVSGQAMVGSYGLHHV
jgi:hypothetical protein